MRSMVVWRLVGVLSLALTLGACAGMGATATGGIATSEVCVGQTPKNEAVNASGDPVPDVAAQLIAGLKNDLTQRNSPADSLFDKLLDCYVGKVDPADLEQRLFRGHVIVTMLAHYGAYNVGRTGTQNAEEISATILRSITNAELSLSQSSVILYQAANGTGTPQRTVLLNTQRVDRIVDVLQVAIDVERPTAARARSGLRAAIAAFGGSPGALKDLVDLALSSIKKATVLAIYGPALRADARADLERVSKAGGVKDSDWAAWDVVLHAACEELAAKAKSPNNCVPSAAILKASFGNGVPSRR